jgi:hypothetical protein
MESHQKSNKRALKQIGIAVNRQNSEDNRLNECRDLVRVLAIKTEILYRECRFDQNKAGHIRTMASTLAALTVLVNRIDHDYRMTIPDILRDSRGFTYKSVRFCDLDRIRDK